ncbi:hypothetical protein [Mucilaginibacter paludis]|uniref:Uncharacterized protein n=1 Tax=Mucilaginibacter paludis DSM 18603 TaxID=714943 RepID=H1YAZ4_9SPHI|nr:hypothetical protein [Mucilaginibacter paludis]EHQ30027.1 hypothetical protein Mucpa_5967 [Mucilaginibacter paludis DSM 18603]
MKKSILITLILFVISAAKAQQAFQGVIANSYVVYVSGGQDRPVKKTISVLYNSDYCKITIGDSVVYFVPELYVNRIAGECNCHLETLFNRKTDAMPRAMYDIQIMDPDRFGKNHLQIRVKDSYGTTFYDADVKDYTGTRTVNGKVYKEDWDDLLRRQRIDENIYMAKEREIERQAHLKDSTEKADARRVELKRKIDQLNTGDNYNRLSFETKSYLQHTLEQALTMKLGNTTAYGDINLLIDRQGNITSCVPGHDTYYLAKCLPYLNEILKELKLKVDPFMADGVSYPSYYPGLDVSIFIPVHYGVR